MATFVLRVWIPDRPGALGAVASRIGSVKADVIGIDIIERGAGRAIDDLVIELPDAELVDLLLAEIAQVDGVDVEDIRELDGPLLDPAIHALQVAGALQRCSSSVEALNMLVQGAERLIGADWAAVLDCDAAAVVASVGEDVPSEKWLGAFVAGVTAEGARGDHDELAVTSLPNSNLKLIVSRSRLPLRSRERSVLEALCGLL
ncbi:MAG: hypothetical protein F2942_05805 [Actinobacteria bacterium]|uniref:Unannotated protein n=1 Tax=freshwater metagenome TaxID=449393 RepID=A0A6J6P1Y8_9ZZZZ|nr:ACT domain-containing protein [Actinomycetota bacterium]MSX74063.1 hypothetical protein [Actinomycetota bacterium]MSY21858.1 hypothetical protein [Actinomycetota bacterium]MTA74213.1 hypothetical protein [Actinomycetota bacterium]